MKRLLSFLIELEALNQANSLHEIGLVVYADDQFINQKQMALQMKDIGMENRLKMFANGQYVINYVSKLLIELQSDANRGFKQVK